MDYRLYLLDERGKIRSVETCHEASDSAAAAQAVALHHHHDIEIWQGARRVGVVAAGQPATSID